VKGSVRISALLVLVLMLAAPSTAVAKPQPKVPVGGPPEITHYTVSVSVDGGPFTEIWRGSDPSAATAVTEAKGTSGADLATLASAGEADSLVIDTNRQLIIGEGQKTVTYRNTAWSFVQPIYYLDNRLTWYWNSSACYLVGRSYTPYAYPGNGWSCYRLNLSSYGGTSPLWSKYQYTYKWNGAVNGVPTILFKNLGLQVNGYVGGSSNAVKF